MRKVETLENLPELVDRNQMNRSECKPSYSELLKPSWGTNTFFENSTQQASTANMSRSVSGMHLIPPKP
jgi:hypothetical protein